MIIAIDGPAASGKGTLGKRLAEHFGLRHLDTGLIYRAVAKALLDAGLALDDRAHAAEAARRLDPATFDEQLKSHAIGEAASIVSAIPDVRAALVAFQRDFAAERPGAVLDGRDIGTIIAPEADAKLFVTASAEVRAERRHREDAATSYDDILADIRARDERDSGRSAAPLRQAEDADLLDTTNLTIGAAVQRAIALVEARIRR